MEITDVNDFFLPVIQTHAYYAYSKNKLIFWIWNFGWSISVFFVPYSAGYPPLVYFSPGIWAGAKNINFYFWRFNCMRFSFWINTYHSLGIKGSASFKMTYVFNADLAKLLFRTRICRILDLKTHPIEKLAKNELSCTNNEFLA